MKTYTAKNHVPFNVRLVRKGESYGKGECLQHEKEMPLIEFYDARFPHTKQGQFVSRYDLETFLRHTGGLNLYGGEPSWTVDWDTIHQIQADIVADRL